MTHRLRSPQTGGHTGQSRCLMTRRMSWRLAWRKTTQNQALHFSWTQSLTKQSPTPKRARIPKKTWCYQRMGRDSNPRWTFAHAGFQDRCLKPLGHPSSFVPGIIVAKSNTPPCSLSRRDADPSSRGSMHVRALTARRVAATISHFYTGRIRRQNVRRPTF
jgi:hypothetical protein